MFLVSVVLVVVAFVTLLLGVFGVGEEPLLFVYVSIASCLLAAVFLTAGVLRGRPSRKPFAASPAEAAPAPWSGASGWAPPDGRPTEAPAASQVGQSHVQVLSARDATASTAPDPRPQDDDADDPEAARYAAALGAAGVSGARVERLRGRFPTVEAVRAASVEELAQVPGISEELARRVHDRLHR